MQNWNKILFHFIQTKKLDEWYKPKMKKKYEHIKGEEFSRAFSKPRNWIGLDAAEVSSRRRPANPFAIYFPRLFSRRIKKRQIFFAPPVRGSNQKVLPALFIQSFFAGRGASINKLDKIGKGGQSAGKEWRFFPEGCRTRDFCLKFDAFDVYMNVLIGVFLICGMNVCIENEARNWRFCVENLHRMYTFDRWFWRIDYVVYFC